MMTRLVCAGAVVLGLFAPRAHAQTIASDRLEARMMIAGARPELAQPMPLIEERIHVSIDGQHATTTLLQVYQNNTSAQVEGRYRLQPGSGSRVEGFAYWNGESKIVGEVFERQTARRVYENVTSRRRDPGLLEEDGEGAFAFRVFPIASQEKKRVELRWTRWLPRHAHTVRYRAPVTRADAEILISINGSVKNVRSSSHRFRMEKVAGGMRLRSEGARGSGELHVEWEVNEANWLPSAYVHRGGGNHDGWFALSLAAPDLPASAVAPKDVTIVVDRSGSMAGEPIQNARAAAADMIRRLNPADRVNVISFSDEVDPLFKAPRPLRGDTRAHAISFVERLRDGGGTDIALALATAINSQDTKPERPRVIVFMTDGQSDVEKSIQAARFDAGDVRLFTVGLGKDVNRPLLQRLAALKRGRFVYIPDLSAIQTELGRLAAQISKPLLVDVSVDVEGAHAVRLYPRSMPDLFAEDELLVTGRLRGTGTARFIVRGTLAGKRVAFTRTVEVGTAPARPWVGRLWAASRVEHLLEDLALGATAPELQEEVLELALAYNFVTPYTAFLAIPESELGDQRGTIEAARERKRKIMAAHADAAAIDQPASVDPMGGRVAMNMPAPSPSTDMADDEAEETYITASGSIENRRGCAGCATSRSGGATGLLLVLALAGIVMRRRRR